MIFRLTLKLAKKINFVSSLPSIKMNEISNPLLDWSVHVFIAERKQYIILTNTASLYSMIMPGKGITADKQFVQEALFHMREFMIRTGNDAIYDDFIEPENDKIFFSKITDRRVLGSMNDLIYQAQIHLEYEHRNLFDVSSRINEAPMSYLNYNCPKDEFQKLCLMKTEERRSNVFILTILKSRKQDID